MFSPHPMKKVLVTLGLLGGLGLASEVQAAHRLRPVPTLQLVLRDLEAAQQNELVRRAEEHVVAALEALGAPARVQALPQPPQGLFVLHNRNKIKLALVGINRVLRDLNSVSGAAASRARNQLARAVVDLETLLIRPFIL
jgi:hypothetical protein